MFIYILNILNDGARKNKINRLSNIEIINDTDYISRLANIKRGFDLKSLNSKIGDIIAILDKYKLNRSDKVELLSKLIVNNNYNWIIKDIYDDFYIKKKENVIIDSVSMLENMLMKAKVNEYTIVDNKDLWTNNIEETREYSVKYFKDIFGEKYINENKEIYSYFINSESEDALGMAENIGIKSKTGENYKKECNHLAIPAGGRERVNLLMKEIRNAVDGIWYRLQELEGEYYESTVLDVEGNLIEVLI